MSKHTPAPWRAIKSSTSSGGFGNGYSLDVVSGFAEGSAPRTVAHISSNMADLQATANANLIAAALDLLAALKEEHGYDDELHLRAMPDCWKCAAIAKAEGRSDA